MTPRSTAAYIFSSRAALKQDFKQHCWSVQAGSQRGLRLSLRLKNKIQSIQYVGSLSTVLPRALCSQIFVVKALCSPQR